VQFAGDAPSLLILQPEQFAGQSAQRGLRGLDLGDVFASNDKAQFPTGAKACTA
jgi:hypothetical protein